MKTTILLTISLLLLGAFFCKHPIHSADVITYYDDDCDVVRLSCISYRDNMHQKRKKCNGAMRQVYVDACHAAFKRLLRNQAVELTGKIPETETEVRESRIDCDPPPCKAEAPLSTGDVDPDAPDKPSSKEIQKALRAETKQEINELLDE